jgi:hypothetical protein
MGRPRTLPDHVNVVFLRLSDNEALLWNSLKKIMGAKAGKNITNTALAVAMTKLTAQHEGILKAE